MPSRDFVNGQNPSAFQGAIYNTLHRQSYWAMHIQDQSLFMGSQGLLDLYAGTFKAAQSAVIYRVVSLPLLNPHYFIKSSGLSSACTASSEENQSAPDKALTEAAVIDFFYQGTSRLMHRDSIASPVFVGLLIKPR